MSTVHDVAAYILSKTGPMTAMKLQKLVYYSQAWNLVWEETPIFNEPIKAWANGPVVPALFAAHKGKYKVDLSDFSKGRPAPLKSEHAESIDAILDFYGDLDAAELSEMTHAELPWKQARGSSLDGEPSSVLIDLQSMKSFYSSLVEEEQPSASASKSADALELA